MADKRVVVSGTITEEYEGGLYNLIDSFDLLGDRDAVIDCFDAVGYYEDDDLLLTDLPRWFKLYQQLCILKGTKDVTLSISTEDEVYDALSSTTGNDLRTTSYGSTGSTGGDIMTTQELVKQLHTLETNDTNSHARELFAQDVEHFN